MEEDEIIERRVIETAAFPWGEPGRGHRGMSLRDYFAAKAMQAVIANIVVAKTADGEYLRNVEDVAELAYKQADAMLKAKARTRDAAKATASEGKTEEDEMKDAPIGSCDSTPTMQTESKCFPNRKVTFGKMRDDLIDAYNCLMAIGEEELGNGLWVIIHKMLHHETLGTLAKATASESGA